jgi:hypothetical protein
VSTDYNNTGSLNPAKDKRSDKSPDWWGKLMVSGEVLEALKQGKPVRVSGWNRDGRFGEFISLRVSVEQETNRNVEPQKQAETEQQGMWPSSGPSSAPPPRQRYKPGTIEGNLARNAETAEVPFDDDIPF